MEWATVMVEWPVLQTERLLLRKLRPEDAEDMFEYASDPLVTRNVLFDTQRSIEETRAFLERMVSRGPDSGRATFGVTLNDGGKLIGICSIFLDSQQSARAEIAYAFGRPYWGKGYATEAARAIVDFGFERLGMNRIEALCRPDNVASARVMEKVGMSYEGLLREYLFAKGAYWDLEMYAILRRDYLLGK